MLKVRVIPCLDVKDGRVVKGINFEGLRDAGDPVEQAIVYDSQGADELCFLDITASHENRGILLDVVHRTAEVCFMPLTVGGGVRSLEDIRALLLAGADKVSVNTAAVSRPEFVKEAAEKFGSQCIVAAIDAKSVGNGKYGDLHPWRAQNPPASTRSPMPKCWSAMARAKCCCSPPWTATASSPGYDLELTRAVSDAVTVPVIASGGVGNAQDLVDGVTKRSCQRGPGGLHFPLPRRSQYLAGQSRAESRRIAGPHGLNGRKNRGFGG